MTLLSARAEVRTAALAAELLQLGVSGGLLVGEAASAVRLGDGLLFRGSEGVSEVLAVACLTSIPMFSAFAAALLCGTESCSLSRPFQYLSALAFLEVIFLCITGVFQPSIHALAWPLAVAVCFSRAAVAWSLRFDAMALSPGATSRPVGARPPRLRSKASVTEKSQQTEVKVKLHFEELDFHDASAEEWREKLLEHFQHDQGISANACANLQIEFAEGSLIAEIFTPPEAQEVLAILESPPNPVILKHQGVTAYASVTIFGKGGQGVYSVQRKCAAAAVAMTQVKRLQMQMQNDLEGMMTSCHQSIQDLDGKLQVIEADTAEQQRKVQSLEAKAKLQLRLTQNEHFVAPRSDRTERPMAVGGGPEVSPEAVAAMAKRLVERTRKDLEAQMAVLQHQFGQVSRELESLSRAAALARGSECDASASTLRKYLVDALVRPSHLEDAQHLALRLLSQALDAATLLSASALAPKVESKAPVEIFEKYEKLQETRRIHEELVAERLQELLATNHSQVSTVLHPEMAAPGPKFLPPLPGGFGSPGGV